MEAARTKTRSWLTIVIITILLLIFAGLLALYYFYRNRDYVDPALAAELRQAKLPDTIIENTDLKGWPQWRGPLRDGISKSEGFRTNWPEDGPGELLKWEQPIGKGYSCPVIVDGRLYVMAGESGTEWIICRDIEDGKELWKREYPCENQDIQYGPGPRSTPCVDGDHVYAVGITGIMHCLNTADGSIVWKKDLLKEFNAANLRWGVSFSPLVLGDLIYTNPGESNGNSIVALNKSTGEPVWRNLNDPGGYSSPIAAEIAGKKQIIFFTGEGLVGVTPDEGKELWRYPISNTYKVNAATPIVSGDYVFASSGYGTGSFLVKVERSGDSLQAKLVYKVVKMRNHFPSCVLYKEHFYGFDDKILRCMNLRPEPKGQTPEFTWSERGLGKGSLTIANGHLIILSEDGLLVLAKASPERFDRLAQMQVLQGRCWTVPVLVDDHLYMRNESKIICLDLRMSMSQ